MKSKLRKGFKDLRWRVSVYRAKRARAKSKATFIGVTGSSGKSTVTALLGHILAAHRPVYTQVLANTLHSVVSALYRRMKQVERADYVVMETGAYGVDSIRPMAEMLQPHVAVVTMVRLEHVASFRTLENVAAEKRALVAALRPGGLAVLNADDPYVADMAAGAGCRVVTFGAAQTADYRVTDIHAAYPDRLTFSIHWRGGLLQIETSFPAEYFWLPTVAAVATALELGVPSDKVVAQVATFQPVVNRCAMLITEGGPQFILDVAKAPWHSINLALDMMAKATAIRKRIVIGQISDYTGSSRKYAHAYQTAREIADQVIYTGDNAHRSRASQSDRDSGQFVELRTVKEVSDHIKRTAVPGELILVKSSSNLHLERIALAWTHDVKCWIPVCGKAEGCQTCGMYELPYEQHRAHVMLRRRTRMWRQFRGMFGGRSS